MPDFLIELGKLVNDYELTSDERDALEHYSKAIRFNGVLPKDKPEDLGMAFLKIGKEGLKRYSQIMSIPIEDETNLDGVDGD